jgi:hypothetical protein
MHCYLESVLIEEIVEVFRMHPKDLSVYLIDIVAAFDCKSDLLPISSDLFHH